MIVFARRDINKCYVHKVGEREIQYDVAGTY